MNDFGHSIILEDHLVQCSYSSFLINLTKRPTPQSPHSKFNAMHVLKLGYERKNRWLTYNDPVDFDTIEAAVVSNFYSVIKMDHPRIDPNRETVKLYVIDKDGDEMQLENQDHLDLIRFFQDSSSTLSVHVRVEYKESSLQLYGSFKNRLYYSQKVLLLKLKEFDDDDDGCLTPHEVVKVAEESFKSIKEAMILSYANLAVVSALVGTTTYSSVLSPPEVAIENDLAYAGLILVVTFNMISTCLNLVCICLATFYIYSMCNLFHDNNDFIWFFENHNSVFVCFIFCVLGVIFALFSFFVNCFLAYDVEVASIAVGFGMLIVLVFF